MKLTLRRKMLIGYGLVLALIVLVIIWSLMNISRLGEASNAILEENYRSILAAENMIDAIERQDSAILMIILNYREKGLKQFHENENQLLQWLGRAKDNITIEGEKQLLSTIEEGYSEYLVLFSKLQAGSDGYSQPTRKLYWKEIFPVFSRVRNDCIRLREMNEKAMYGTSTLASAISRRAKWSILIVGLAAIIGGLLFGIILTGRIIRPVNKIIEAAIQVGKGDYSVTVPESTTVELAHLAEEFNRMVYQLKQYNDMNIGKLIGEKSKNEAVIRSIDDGVIVFDNELRITSINPMAAACFDVERDSVIGNHFLEVISDENIYTHLKQASENGKEPHIEEDARIIDFTRDGETRYYSFSIVPARGDEGMLYGIILLLRDVTRLKELDKMKDEFVMTASHELRTPLTGIGMSIDLLLEKENLDEREQHLLEVAHEELLRLKTLVNDLLDLSKIESGRVEMELETVPVKVMVEKTLEVLMPQAKAGAVDLDYNISDSLPPVRADANKITWVLTNLVSNALRYTDAEGQIRVTADKTGNFVQVSVSDNGKGIPWEYQSKIFNKFVSIKTDNIVGGAGLGLAICKEIIHAHGGTIWVESSPGNGSTFSFTLPISIDKG